MSKTMLALSAVFTLVFLPASANPVYTTVAGPDQSIQLVSMNVSRGLTWSSNLDAGSVAHAYISAAGGAITLIAPPGSTSAISAAINDSGTVAGCYGIVVDRGRKQLNEEYGFARDASGTITSFHVAGSPYTCPTAINSKGAITGAYQIYNNGEPGTAGFIRSSAGGLKKFAMLNAISTAPRAINDTGTVVGAFIDSNDERHGFVRSTDGTITTIDAPGADEQTAAGGTTLTAINHSGTIAGSFTDSNWVTHAFVRSPTGSFTVFDAPDAGTDFGAGTDALGINASGDITGDYKDSNSNFHGFVRSKDGKSTEFDVPGSSLTQAISINSSGAIAGRYRDANGLYNIFIRSK